MECDGEFPAREKRYLKLMVEVDELIAEGSMLVCEETSSKSMVVLVSDEKDYISLDYVVNNKDPIIEFDLIINDLGAFLDVYREKKTRVVEVSGKKKKK